MAKPKKDSRPVQTTEQGASIPIPTREEVEQALADVVKEVSPESRRSDRANKNKKP